MNLEEAHGELLKLLPAEVMEAMRQGTERQMGLYHFTLGSWMRHEWRLWSDGPLAVYFRREGIVFPDDMSDAILITFRRRLLGLPLDLEGLAAWYQDYWSAQKSRHQAADPNAPVNPLPPADAPLHAPPPASGGGAPGGS